MSLLQELNTIMDSLGRGSSGSLPVETGVFRGDAPDEYVVLTPMADVFEGFGDNRPYYETQSVRVSLFSKTNYQSRKKQICRALLAGGITITDRAYIGHEDDTGYHHYAIDTTKLYALEE